MSLEVQKLGSVLLVGLVVCVRFIVPVSADGADSLEIVPEDTCILELTLPAGATVSVDGRDYGTTRRLTFRPLEPGLLAAIMRGERPLPEIEIGKQLPPKLRIVSPQSGTIDQREIEVVVEATDQGGGISNLAISQNGVLPLAERRRREDVPIANRGRMGVRMSCGNGHDLFLG